MRDLKSRFRANASVFCVLFMLLSFGGALRTRLAMGQAGTVEIDLLESETEEPLVCRVQILDSKGRPLRGRGTRFQAGWNLVESPLVFRGRPGDYTYRVLAGPQFAAGSGGFTIDKNSESYDVLRMPRYADLESETWFGGDLASHFTVGQTAPWLPAEDLSMAVSLPGSGDVEATGKEQGEGEPGTEPVAVRWVESQSYFDDRDGSGLALHHWAPPATVPAELPSSRLLVLAKQQASQHSEDLAVHAEIVRLWARDTPIWLASRKIDSIQLLGPHVTVDGNVTNFEPAFDPEPGRYRGPLRPGQLVEHLYWQVLEAGMRIPPTAGSHFGRNRSPLGYNRVYASVADNTPAAWWQAIRAGRSFVTSGPLLRTTINGEMPGAIFTSEAGGTLELDVQLKLTVSDPVDYLDVIFNGKSLYEARLDEHAKRGGRIPKLTVSESGWLLVRVVTGRGETYRIATTAPYYVEIGGAKRVSRQAVEMFQRWLEASADDVSATQGEPGDVYLRAAREFWQNRLQQANAP